jgi:superoxide dismutase, Cu-Zn family
MKAITSLAILAAAAALSACGTFGSSGPKAVATLEPTKGNTAAGTVTFQQKGDKVLVTASITGLKPSGDGMSTAGHFNPNGKPHGPQDHDHHAGDFPGLKADANGNVNTSFELSGVSLGSGTSDLVGRGLIVHAGADDYKTQPTGNSGARIACGVIKAS